MGMGTVTIAAAQIVLGVSRLVPIGVVQFYLQPAAALPLAAEISAGRSPEHNGGALSDRTTESDRLARPSVGGVHRYGEPVGE